MHNLYEYLFISYIRIFHKEMNTPHHSKGKIQGVQKQRVYLLTQCTDYALAFAFSATFRSESALVTEAPET